MSQRCFQQTFLQCVFFFDIHNYLLPNIVFKEFPMVDESIDVPIDDAEESKSKKKPTEVDEGSTNSTLSGQSTFNCKRSFKFQSNFGKDLQSTLCLHAVPVGSGLIDSSSNPERSNQFINSLARTVARLLIGNNLGLGISYLCENKQTSLHNLDRASQILFLEPLIYVNFQL